MYAEQVLYPKRRHFISRYTTLVAASETKRNTACTRIEDKLARLRDWYGQPATAIVYVWFFTDTLYCLYERIDGKNGRTSKIFLMLCVVFPGRQRCGTGLPNPSSETNLSGANGDREISIFPVQLTTSRIGNLIR